MGDTQRAIRIGVALPVREMASDLAAIRDFAQAAEALGFDHLRVPDQVIRPNDKYLHEPLMLLSYLAAVTRRIELVTSVIVLPVRQTALFARQAAELDVLSEGRLRLGIGVGGSQPEYAAMGVDFHTRGLRCDEQLALLRLLWTQSRVDFSGRFDHVVDNGINPLPVQRPIPVWIGASAAPGASVVQRIGRHAAGWFVLTEPHDFAELKARIDAAARSAGRDPAAIGAEAGVAVVGPRRSEWQARVARWSALGLTHLCLRTLGANLPIADHIPTLQAVHDRLPY